MSMGFQGRILDGVCCHALLQRIFLTQRSNPNFLCLLHWQTGSLPPGKPNLEWLDLKPSQEVHGLSSLPFKSVYFNETRISFFPPKGNRCKLFDSPSASCSSTIRSMLKRPDRSLEESPGGTRKRRKSVAGASPEEAASPEKPQEVSSAASFSLKDIVSFSSKMHVWFFFFAETGCF